LKRLHFRSWDCWFHMWLAGVATCGQVEGSPRALGDICEALGKVDPQSSTCLPEAYFPKAPMDVVAGGVSTNYSDE
jgi:hypothetical protein